MNELDYKTIRKASRWIPIKKWRHGFRDSMHSIIEREKFDFLHRYLRLITPTYNREEQKRILKHNLALIEIEIASFCNRKCWFCPNSIIDRKTSSIEFPEDLYMKILGNLKEISYSGTLNFHRFNEPLANKELILTCVTQARERLALANLGIFTNGDYLDRSYLDDLKKAGINYIIMSYYFDKNKEFDIDNIIKPAIDKMADKLQLHYKETIRSNMQYGVTFLYEGVDILYRAWNPRTVGSDRGGAMDDDRLYRVKRDYGCYYPWCHMYIDYNGLVMPCCNMRSDVKEHKDFILGDIRDNDLFSMFMNEKFINIRKYLTPDNVKGGPCEYCHGGSKDIIAPFLRN